MEPTIQNEKPFTYGRLLVQLLRLLWRDILSLSLVRMSQPVTGWSDSQHVDVVGVDELEEVYEYDGYEGYWPQSDLAQSPDFTPGDEATIPAHTVKLLLK